MSVSGTSGITYTASTGGSGWLAVTSNYTVPGQLSIGVNPARLRPGAYTGAVTVTSAGVSGSPATIPVTLNISAGALSVSPNSLSLSYQPGDAVTPQAINITNPAAVTNFNISVPSGCAWVVPSSLSGTTPANVSIAVSASGLSAGAHNCTLTVSGAGESHPLLVAFAVSGPALKFDPAGNPVFSYAIGGAAPASQTVKLSSTSASEGVPFGLSYACPWVSITPPNGANPGFPGGCGKSLRTDAWLVHLSRLSNRV